MRNSQIMKHILVATDLSLSASNAAEYAAQLAVAAGARLTLMSVYKPVPVLAAGSEPGSQEYRRPEIVMCRLEDKAVRLNTTTGVRVDVISRAGESVRAILATARDTGADLIIIGNTGTEGREGVAFGNTAVALAKKTTIPLLIVPGYRHYAPLKAIAIAKDVLREQTPAILRELLGLFASGLYLFQLTGHGPEEAVEIGHSDAIHYTKEQFHQLYSIPVGKHLQHSIENFIESNPIDLLVARPIPGMQPDRWMLKNTNKDLIFGIHVPLLILP